MFVNFPNFFLLLISSFIPLWLEMTLDMISVFLNFLRYVLWPHIWSILEHVPCALEKNVYSVLLDRMFGICLFVRFILSIVLLKSALPILISVWMIYPLLKVGYWHPLLLLLLFLPLVMLLCFIYLGATMLGTYICTIFLSSWWIDPFIIV